MKESRLASYLSSHRKRSGLSQKELGQLLGYPSEGTVSRHERLCSTPPFQVALGYEAVFRVPVSELFPGALERIRQEVEQRIARMERQLQDSSAKGREAARIARKLEWIWERQNQEKTPHNHDVESALRENPRHCDPVSAVGICGSRRLVGVAPLGHDLLREE